MARMPLSVKECPVWFSDSFEGRSSPQEASKTKVAKKGLHRNLHFSLSSTASRRMSFSLAIFASLLTRMPSSMQRSFQRHVSG